MLQLRDITNLAQANITNPMTLSSFEIRLCISCGLRYPIVERNSFGLRCPLCLGETQIIVMKQFGKKKSAKVINKNNQHNILAVLVDNVRSAWNVGSILRSADGFGFSHAYLCGITPTPENKSVAKTSLGAEDSVTWSHHKDAVKLVKGLKKEGWKIIALEEDERAQAIGKSGNGGQNSVLIVGNEVTGIDPDLLDLADEIIYIPMHGQKKSFNVAVAFGVAGFALGYRL